MATTKGCHCGLHCPGGGDGLPLALDGAPAAGDRLMRALRKRFRTPADALRALGLDASVLEEGEKLMSRYAHDARSRDMRRTRDEDPEEMDPNRDWRDEASEGGEGEPREEELLALLRDLTTEDRRMIMDWARGRAPTYDRGRRGARDDPPPFAGMPETGGGMYGSSTNWSDREAQDRRMSERAAADKRRRSFAHDMAERSGDGFFDMFPQARRIGILG